MAGDIYAETTNGSIHADLTGPTWHGRCLSATTTNGAVSVSVPPSYSAHLVASTVNGGTSLNAPGRQQLPHHPPGNRHHLRLRRPHPYLRNHQRRRLHPITHTKI